MNGPTDTCLTVCFRRNNDFEIKDKIQNYLNHQHLNYRFINYIIKIKPKNLFNSKSSKNIQTSAKTTFASKHFLILCTIIRVAVKRG